MRKVVRLLIGWLLLLLGGVSASAQPDIEDWTDVAWSPDGVFVIGVQNEVVTYLYADGQLQQHTRSDPYHMTIDRVSWSPDSARFVFSADDSFPGSEGDAVLAVWAMPEFTRQRDWLSDKFETDTPDHLSQIEHATWHPDGQRIISLVTQGEALLLAHWDAVTLTPTLLPFQSAPTYVRTIALSPDGDRLSLSGGFGAAPERYFALQLLDSESGVPLWEQRSENIIVSISWLSEEIFAAARGDTIEIWNAATGELQQTLEAEPDAGIYEIRWSPDGRFIAVLKFGGDLTIWSVETGERVMVVYAGNGVTRGVLAFDWHPDGSSIAAALADEWDLRLFDVSALTTE